MRFHDETARSCMAVLRLLSGPEAEPAWLAKIIATMPSAEKSRAPEDTLQLLNTLGSLPTWMLSPASIQGLHGWLVGIISKLCEDEVYKPVGGEVHPNASAILSCFQTCVRQLTVTIVLFQNKFNCTVFSLPK